MSNKQIVLAFIIVMFVLLIIFCIYGLIGFFVYKIFAGIYSLVVMLINKI